jgi:HEAT repeat protein
MLPKQIKTTIKEINSQNSAMARANAAQLLEELTKKVNPASVSDATLEDMIKLLDSNEESVRLWVAAALGDLGPRANKAAPKLLRMLPEADKTSGSLTSAPFIRSALVRMGVTPPPPGN